jgi:hypothetical protein
MSRYFYLAKDAKLRIPKTRLDSSMIGISKQLFILKRA